MQKPVCYLAGPMSGLTFEDCMRWRTAAASDLNAFGIATINPVELGLKNHKGEISSLGAEGIMSTQRAMVEKDRYYVLHRVTCVLLNFTDSPRVSIGSVCELAWADSRRIPVVTVLPPGNIHDHAFVRELSGWVVDDLDTAISVLKMLYIDCHLTGGEDNAD